MDESLHNCGLRLCWLLYVLHHIRLRSPTTLGPTTWGRNGTQKRSRPPAGNDDDRLDVSRQSNMIILIAPRVNKSFRQHVALEFCFFNPSVVHRRVFESILNPVDGKLYIQRFSWKRIQSNRNLRFFSCYVRLTN